MISLSYDRKSDCCFFIFCYCLIVLSFILLGWVSVHWIVIVGFGIVAFMSFWLAYDYNFLGIDIDDEGMVVL